MALKTTLTTEEVHKVAYLHHVLGVEQHVLSVAFSVNVGRISEACIAMEYAARDVPAVYQQARQSRSEFPRLIDDEAAE
jgi:hypothetical protein